MQINWIETGELDRGCELMPDYASSFIYELSKFDGTFYVKVLYNGKPIRICEQSKKSHGDYCKFSEFEKTVEKHLYYNYGDLYDFCGNPYFSDKSIKQKDVHWQQVKLSLWFALPACILLSLIIWLWACKHRIKAWLQKGHKNDAQQSRKLLADLKLD